MGKKEYQFETLCVAGDAGYAAHDDTGAISLPIYQSACYGRSHLGQSSGFDYTRVSNPTREHLEHTVAALDHAEYGFAFATGMAAITAFFDMVPQGRHVIVSEDIYGGTIRLFDNIGTKLGLKFSYIDTSNLQNVAEAFRPETKYVFIETPGNPLMTVTDIRECARLAHEHGAKLIVDNTFLTPYFQQPLALGADAVIQSGSKYLSGHNDTLSGFVTTNDYDIAQNMTFITKTTGASLSPFDSWLTYRGIKTLAVRLERQAQNAMQAALALQKNPHVSRVLYPGLPDCPGYELNKSQASGFGGMVSFYVDSAERARHALEKIRLIHFAESLGGTDSLMTYPFTQTHADIPEPLRIRKGITENLLRLSVGIENAADIIADLEQALGE